MPFPSSVPWLSFISFFPRWPVMMAARAADLSDSINLEKASLFGHYDPVTNPAGTRLKARDMMGRLGAVRADLQPVVIDKDGHRRGVVADPDRRHPDRVAVLIKADPGGRVTADSQGNLGLGRKRIIGNQAVAPVPSLIIAVLSVVVRSAPGVGRGEGVEGLAAEVAAGLAAWLTPPLRERFGVVLRVEYYTLEDLEQIVKRSAKILAIPIDDEGAFEIARRSRGTPRVANRILRRVRDYAQVEAEGVITRTVAGEALDMLGVDDQGLDKMDRHIMLTIIQKFNGGPIGLDTLSAAVSEEKDTLEDVYEPFLIQMGYIKRTPRGRVATKLAYSHFGIPMDECDPQQKKLF